MCGIKLYNFMKYVFYVFNVNKLRFKQIEYSEIEKSITYQVVL